MYVNGALVAQSKSKGALQNNDFKETTYYIGDHNPTQVSYPYWGPYPFTGNITGARIVKGVVYTGPFAVPTTPFTATTTANTVFLLDVQGPTVFVDFVPNSKVQQLDSNVTVSGTVKFATQSVKFSKSGAVVVYYKGTSLKTALNSTDTVTIEWWMYLFSGYSSPNTVFVIGDVAPPYFVFYINGTTYEIKSANGSVPVKTLRAKTNAVSGVWIHCAIVRRGTQFRFYLNGNLEIVDDYNITFASDLNSFYIGGNIVNNSFDGIIDSFIVRNGVPANEISSTFTTNTSLVLPPSAKLAYNFATSTPIAVPSTAPKDNSVFLLLSNGASVILTKIEVNLVPTSSGAVPAPSPDKKKSNWIVSGGLSFDEDVPFIGTFITAALVKKTQSLAPGAACVDFYNGLVFVGGTTGIYTYDSITLNLVPSSTFPLLFSVISIKAYENGFILTSADHKIYHVSLYGVATLLYSSTVLGLPDSTDTMVYVPEPEQSQLVVVDLANPIASAITFITLDNQFAPSFV
jgi:hypothetical protein